MSRRIVTKSEWARMHGWHPSNVSYLLKKGIISERQDGRLDLRQVEAQLTEHTKRPTLFRNIADAEFGSHIIICRSKIIWASYRTKGILNRS